MRTVLVVLLTILNIVRSFRIYGFGYFLKHFAVTEVDYIITGYYEMQQEKFNCSFVQYAQLFMPKL